MKKLFLISNSTVYGKKYLDHVETDLKAFLGNIRSVLFVPYALHDRDTYASIASERFKKMGIDLLSVHTQKNKAEAVEKTPALFIGGGNTFRLLSELYKENLISVIKKRVEEGMVYIGSSAGSNLACPTIKTTNDMPIVQPPSFDALNLVSFQINAHYIEPDQNSTHMGETRPQRIKEYLEENNVTVVGLKEGTWLKIEKNIQLHGNGFAKIFRKNQNPELLVAPATISNL